MKKNTDPNQPASYHALSAHRDKKAADDSGFIKDPSKLIAFYLPQYHRVEENSQWWGPGFTEWTNVARGRPNFEGHYQPHIPRELGFYDLDRIETMREQAELAHRYGIHGFCFYYYWFSGRRILERPVENFLKSDIDLSFCLCWANENWTRTWDGDNKSVLLEQKYAEGDEERFIDDLAPYFADARYIRVDGKPLLLVYRIKQLPDPALSITKWRRAAEKHGLPGLHISVVDFYDISDPREVGADALVEFPPHKFNGPQNHPAAYPHVTNPAFHGGLIEYSKVIAQSILRPTPEYTLYRGIIPSWDNTARRQDTGTILINATPSLFGAWLKFLRLYTQKNHPKPTEQLIFVNAWNEWGEGCHLEPDVKWGLGYLDEVARTANIDTSEIQSLDSARVELLRDLKSVAARDGITIEADLTAYKPVNSRVQRLAWKLKKHPLLHKIARKLYRAAHALLH